MFSKNKIIAVVLGAFLLVGGFFYLNQTDWRVLNEKDEYVNVVKQTQKPLILIATPPNKAMWEGIVNVAVLAPNMKKIDGRVGVVAPIAMPQILESIQQTKEKYSLDIDIYLAPNKLWKKLFGVNGDDFAEQSELKPMYLFFNNGKELHRTSEQRKWLSEDGLDFLNKLFDANFNILGL